MDDGVTICIPTFDRPAMLEQAVASCLAQRHRPLELLIGDDSRGDAGERWASSAAMPAGVTLRHERRRPHLGQAGNVNRLFDGASHDRLMLLHDDDLLLPGGLDRLVQAWDKAITPLCVYGRQFLADEKGRVLADATDAWNEATLRTAAHRGRQRSPLVAALRQQVPNDGFLLRTDAARTVRYASEDAVGHCVDAEFALRLAASVPDGDFVHVDADVSVYRIHQGSIARTPTINRRQDLFYEEVRAIGGGAAIDEARDLLLRRIGAGAALDAAMAGRRRAALAILRSGRYAEPRLSLSHLYRLAAIVSPAAATAAKRLIDRLARRARHDGDDG